MLAARVSPLLCASSLGVASGDYYLVPVLGFLLWWASLAVDGAQALELAASVVLTRGFSVSSACDPTSALHCNENSYLPDHQGSSQNHWDSSSARTVLGRTQQTGTYTVLACEWEHATSQMGVSLQRTSACFSSFPWPFKLLLSENLLLVFMLLDKAGHICCPSGFISCLQARGSRQLLFINTLILFILKEAKLELKFSVLSERSS